MGTGIQNYVIFFLCYNEEDRFSSELALIIFIKIMSL